MKIAINAKHIATSAMLGAAAVVLMVIQFPVPFLIPDFVKLDFSELPALLASFSLGPIYGVFVCFIKNAIHLLFTTTAGVGELSNFLLGCCFVIPAGLIYRAKKRRSSALLGAVIGTMMMALVGIPINYFISYPVYFNFIPKDAIIGMYQALLPSVDSLIECLVIFNAPFTLLKGALTTGLAFLVYKPLSPLLHR